MAKTNPVPLDEEQIPLYQAILNKAVLAKTRNCFLQIDDVRIFTCGHVKTVTPDYIEFDDPCYEIVKTGKIGDKPKEYEKVRDGGKIVTMQSIISAMLVESFK